jgi:hypothetical protein
MDMKPFYEMTDKEIANTNAALIELQLQEGQISWTKVAEHIRGTSVAIETLKMQLDTRDSELSRKHEWWQTYRAAVVGNAAGGKLTVEEVREFSIKLADATHGPLEKTKAE